MRSEIAYAISGMEDRITYALTVGVGVILVFLLVVAVVLYSAKRGWL